MAAKEKKTVEVVKVVSHSEGVKSFYLRFVDSEPIEYQAGQFVIAHIPRDNAIVKRAYSIASSPSDTKKDGLLEICLNKVELGYVSNWFHKIPEETRFEIDGPHGVFLVPDNVPRDLVFCGTGTGIAPIRSILKEMQVKNTIGTKDIWLFFGVRNEEDVLYHQEWKELEDKYPNFHYLPSVSQPKQWKGENRYVQFLLQEKIKEPSHWEVYACGHNAMIKELGQVLDSMGFAKDQLHYDRWG